MILSSSSLSKRRAGDELQGAFPQPSFQFELLDRAIGILCTSEQSYVWIFVSVFMYAIGYMGLRQPEIFYGPYNQNLTVDGLTKKKYEKSALTPEKAEEYLQKLRHVVAREKPFLKSEITLPELAKHLAISPHHLSQIINEQLRQNFFEFVNSHRIEEAKKLIIDPENKNVNIAEIAFEVGFNSLSVFNTAFKKHTGMTPSQFREHACQRQSTQSER